MAVDYALWPTGDDVVAFLNSTNIAINISADSVLMDMRLNAVQTHIEYVTKRQFLKGSAGEERLFDGSGTSAMQLDDYIDVTKVELVNSVPTSSTEITDFVEPERKHYAKTRIYLFQGVPGLFHCHRFTSRFPEGYRNVRITAQWGYDTTIPEDVWYAALLLTASDIADSQSVSSFGKPLNWKEDDVSETYYQKSPGEAAGWRDTAEKTLKSYRRSLKSYLRDSKARVI